MCLFIWVFGFLCVCVPMGGLIVSSRQLTRTLKCPPDSPVVLMRALQSTGVKGQWIPKLLGQVTLSPGPGPVPREQHRKSLTPTLSS